MCGDMLIVSIMGQVMVNGNYLLASYTTETWGSGEAAGHSLNTKATWGHPHKERRITQSDIQARKIQQTPQI